MNYQETWLLYKFVILQVLLLEDPCGDGWEVYKGTCPDGNKLLKNLELENLGWKDWSS